MKRLPRLASLVTALGALLLPAVARAQEPYPTSFARRPLVAPEGVGSASLGLSRLVVDVPAWGVGRITWTDYVLSLGASFAPYERLEVSASGFGVSLKTGNVVAPVVGARVLLLRGEHQIALEANWQVRQESPGVADLSQHDGTFGIPVLVRPTRRTRFDIRPSVSVHRAAYRTEVSVGLALGAGVQVTEALYLGGFAGVAVVPRRPTAVVVSTSLVLAYTVTYPMSVSGAPAGATREAPLVDLIAQFDLPFAFASVGGESIDRSSTYALTLGARFLFGT